jgi:chromosome segregation ATPase
MNGRTIDMPLPIPTNEILSLDKVLEIAAIAISSGTVGIFIKSLFDQRTSQKELDIKSRVEEHAADINTERVDIERNKEDIGAAKQLADILTTIVNPLATRVSNMENDAIDRQRQINVLSGEVLELRKVVHTKDMQIIELTALYQSQVAISASQDEKIQSQSRKIVELEAELKELKNRSNLNGNNPNDRSVC